MSKRRRALIVSGSALLLGGALYVFLRPDTYIAHFFNGVNLVHKLRYATQPIRSDFLRYYFPDFLWAFALCCGLFAVTDATAKKAIWLGILTVGCCWLWEGLQWLEVLSGTGDFVDMLLYLVAAVVAVIMYAKGLDK